MEAYNLYNDNRISLITIKMNSMFIERTIKMSKQNTIKRD